MASLARVLSVSEPGTRKRPAGSRSSRQDRGMSVVPPKLQPGSSVRVIAPSRSIAIISTKVRELASQRLMALGLEVSTFCRVTIARYCTAGRLDICSSSDIMVA